MRIAIITARGSGSEAGGAERFYQALIDSFAALGHSAVEVPVTIDEPDFGRIQRNYLACYDLDLRAYDMVVSTKAPTWMVRHPRHVCYLVHTIRVFYDMFDQVFPTPWADLLEQRAWIHRIDTLALSPPKCRAVFTIGKEVSDRLRAVNGIEAQVLHPPLWTDVFELGPQGDAFFLPGRLHPWKRVDLVIRAFRKTRYAKRLLIAGTGESESELRALADGDQRIEFLGRISDEALVRHYAEALAVPFVPIREDYGYVTLEAFASGKPVITCSDSGEAANIVRHGVNGLVCEPDDDALASAMDELARQPRRAAAMGLEGRAWVKGMSWPKVAQQLIDAAGGGTLRTRVVIFDMQPITPAIGGGRQRLLGLYHALGDEIDAVYVGSYDWPGERFRDHQLTPGLREICVPLSDAHHAAAKASTERHGGRVTIDMEFHRQVALSPEYLAVARREMAGADVVVFSHPWCFPPLAEELRPNQLVVYDSQNVEALLRVQLHGDVPGMEALLRDVARVEGDLLQRSDLVYCCSSEEVELYRDIFAVPLSKLRVAPNGAFLHPLASSGAASAGDGIIPRRKMEAGSRPLVAFMGSQYGPNAEAGRYIVERLAPELPNIDFVVIGGLREVLDHPGLPPNVTLTGVISDDEKLHWLWEADLAVNPMLSGAGTNVKMFDFLAAGLPVVTTKVGARGIVASSTADGAVIVVETDGLAASISSRLARGVDARERAACRALVDRRFNNSRISGLLGRELRFLSRGSGVRRPKVAVFSTWGIACGIAEHARYLAEGFRRSGVDPIILGNRVAHHSIVGFEGDLQFPVTRLWHWDNLQWRDSDVDWSLVGRALDEEQPDALVIQHHSAFLSASAWRRLVDEAAKRGIPAIVECHDPRSAPLGDLLGLIAAGGTVVVHSGADRERLVNQGVDSMVVPLGIREVRTSERHGGAGEVVVGGFGFFRAHKGIDVVLEALARLSLDPVMPRLTYRGWHAVYPGEENSEYVRHCLDVASSISDKVGVEIRTDFLDIDEVMAELSTCDVLALAYAPSSEGGSASAGAALASGTAIVCTPSGIFDNLGDSVLRSSGFGIDDFTVALRMLLTDADLRDEYAKRSAGLGRSRNYCAVASELFSLCRNEGRAHV